MSTTATEKPAVKEPAIKEDTKQYYAWINIPYGHTAKGSKIEHKTAKAGDKVDQEMLGLSDDDWQYFVDGKMVRRSKYPTGVKRYESPKRTLIRNANEQMEKILAGASE